LRALCGRPGRLFAGVVAAAGIGARNTGGGVAGRSAGFAAVDLFLGARNFDAVGAEGGVSTHEREVVDVAGVAFVGLEVLVEVDDDGGGGVTIVAGGVEVFGRSEAEAGLDDAVVHAGFDGDSGFVGPDLADGQVDRVVEDAGGGDGAGRKRRGVHDFASRGHADGIDDADSHRFRASGG